jgi:uncharacterized protein (TIGR02265 family)
MEMVAAEYSAEHSEGFEKPDFLAPLDLEAFILACPADAQIKGLFFNSLIGLAKRHSPGDAPLLASKIAFKNYPAAEWAQVAHDCARATFPDQPIREGLRRVGRAAYPAFRTSMVGRAILSLAVGDLKAALRLVPRAYGVVGTKAEGRHVDVSPTCSIIELRQCWDLADCHEVGVFEGVMNAYGAKGEVSVRRLSLGDVDLKISW